MRNQYRDLGALLDAELRDHENPETADLISRLRAVHERGYLTKDEFLEICRRKSQRTAGLQRRNSAGQIERVSREVFGTDYEKRRIERLTSLHGVGIPTASAILAFTDPERYGIIDIRVWQLLYRYRVVTVRPSGTSFTFENWYTYLMKLRYFAEKRRTTARLVELTLFEHDKYVRDEKLAGSRAVRTKVSR